MICILCPKGCEMTVEDGEEFKLNGNKCDKGINFAKTELISPERTLTSTIRIKGAIHEMLPVKTSCPIPKSLMDEVISIIDRTVVASPVRVGDVLIEDVLGTKANIVATRSM